MIRMPKVQFKATPGMRSHEHQKAGRRAEPNKGGPNAMLIPRILLHDGDVQEMGDFEANWCLAAYPNNFSLADKPKKPKFDKDEI